MASQPEYWDTQGYNRKDSLAIGQCEIGSLLLTDFYENLDAMKQERSS